MKTINLISLTKRETVAAPSKKNSNNPSSNLWGRVTWMLISVLFWFLWSCASKTELRSGSASVDDAFSETAMTSTTTTICAPGLDSDNDGVPDWRDKCPQEPETYNKFMDGDGCPDNSHRVIEMHPTVDYIVAFVINGNDPKHSFKESDLDSIAGRLQQYSRKIKIVEITWAICESNEKTHRYASELAQAIRCQLIHHGVAPKRLVLGNSESAKILGQADHNGDCQKNQYIYFRVLSYDESD